MTDQESKSQTPLFSQEEAQKDNDQEVIQKDLNEEQLEVVAGGGLGSLVFKGAKKVEQEAFQLPNSGKPFLLVDRRGPAAAAKGDKGWFKRVRDYI